MTSSPSPRRTHVFHSLGWLATALVALAPWWRNHTYLRDFFDYGVMIKAAGRINNGESPFVDFVTPLQSGVYWINAGVERLFGGDYIALTQGNALFICAAIAILWASLFRRENPIAAMLVVLTVVVGSASQHTLIWYNAIGTVTLAGIAWGTAQYPVLTSSNWLRGGAIVLLLVWSGINKINFHVLALTVACAWTLRAGILKTHAWRPVAITVGAWLIAGLVLPVLLELQLTGASFAQWKANVIDLPFSAPGYGMDRILTPQFLLSPIHDYYGPVLQPVGAILLVWVGLTIALAWPSRSAWDRALLLGAGAMALGGTFGLLATNHEIVYVALASGVALIVSLWLGFDLWSKVRLRMWLLVAPTAVFAVVMFYSAWLGQRSQFGHATLDRSTYQAFADGEAPFTYLAGLHIPPELHESITKLDEVIPAPDPNGKHPVFYATGAEFLERVWPNRNLPSMPLLLDFLNVGELQLQTLKEEFGFPPRFKMVVGMTSWLGSWPVDLTRITQRTATNWEVGHFSVSRFSSEGLNSSLPPQDSALVGQRIFGGNTDPHQIVVTDPIWPFELGEDYPILGVDQGRGSFQFRQPSFRVAGRYALQKYPAFADTPMEVQFKILDTVIPEGEMGSVIWHDAVSLGPGESIMTKDYFIDSRGRSVKFVVEVPAEHTKQVKAGFYMPEVKHSNFELRPAPTLRYPVPAAELSATEVAQAALPADWVDRMEIEIRGGKITDDQQLLLLPGDELWLRPKEPIQELIIQSSLTASVEDSGYPVIRAFWYRGGRMEVLHQLGYDNPDRRVNFNMWPVEDDGWYGLLMDRGHNPNGVLLEVNRITPRPSQ